MSSLINGQYEDCKITTEGNNEIKEINQTVLDDLTVSNEKMSHIIPGSL